MDIDDKKMMKNKDGIIRYSIYLILTTIIMVGFFVLMGFGISNYSSSDDFDIDQNFKAKYEVQFNVEFADSDKDINFVANYFEDTLEFVSLNESEVSIIDENNLLVTFPIDSFDWSSSSRYNLETQSNLENEVFSIALLLSNTTKVEFRTPDGALLIDEFGNFIEPALPETGTPTSNPFVELPGGEISTYEFDLIEKAWVDYDNGFPVIQFLPTQQAQNAFREGAQYLYQTSQTPTETGEIVDQNQYVMWFGYSTLEYIVTQFDSDGYSNAGNNLLTYIFTDEEGVQHSEPRDIAKPFFITYGSVLSEVNVFQDYYTIYGDFSVSEAKSIVRRINFSSENLDITVENYSLVYNDASFSQISWLIWFFLAVIILIAFFFMFWFGLLGVIVSSFNLIVGLGLLAILSTYSIPISLPIILFGFAIALFMFFTSYLGINIFKLNTDLNKSTLKKSKENFLKISQTIIPTALILIITLGTVGFFVSFGLQVAFYFLMIGLLLVLANLFILVIPTLILFDYMFEYSYFVNQRKWSWIVGNISIKIEVFGFLSKSYNNLYNTNDKDKSIKMFAIFGIFVVFITLGIFGIFYATSGQVVNKIQSSEQYYKYDIVRLETAPTDRNDLDYEIQEYKIVTQDENDRYNQKMYQTQTQDDLDEIVDIFNDNNVNIFKAELRRFEKYEFIDLSEVPGGTDQFAFSKSFSYGFSIYTTTQITQDLVTQLESYQFENGENENIFRLEKDENASTIPQDEINTRISEYRYGYYFLPTSSLVDGDINNQKLIENNVSYNNDLANNFWAFVVMLIIIVIVFWLFFNFATSFAAITGILIETFTYLFLASILFVPFSPIFFIGLFITTLISVFSKAFFINKSKYETKFRFKSIILTEVLLIVNTIIAIVSVGIFGFAALTYFVISIIALFAILLNNLYFFGPVSEKLSTILNARKKEKFEEIKWRSKQDDVISEEFIEGINEPNYD